MIKTTNVLSTISVLTLVAAAGCAAPASEAPEVDEENLGQTSAALTNVDACAMGTTPNAVGNIAALHSSESYSRASGFIDGICPSLGKDRPLTIVDFTVTGINGSENRFDVTATWWTATNPVDCSNLQLNVRLQRLVPGTTTFETVGDPASLHGVWAFDPTEPNFGHCNAPSFGRLRVNTQSYTSSETSRYRVRAEAFQWDHDYHATVDIKGRNVSH